jgi:glutathione S-transferase
MSYTETASGIMQVYGSKISYYTGKFEAYLRYRGIPYEMAHYVANRKKMKEGAGVIQMPVVQLADGRWMTDTTPMIAWMEAQQTAPRIYPADSVLNFFALLIEDYADEWLWRAAMHYRWTYRPDRQYAAESLYNELVSGVRPLPRYIALNVLKRRQLGGFVRGDGVNKTTRFHADRTYLTALDCLQAIFERRPFILGQTPTLADFGMMAPMFRHFSQDPTPAEIMRTRAPAVYEWAARMWNLRPAASEPQLVTEADGCLEALLTEACETNLAQHRQNAEAYGRGDKHFDMVIQDCQYRNVPTSRYRVWCLEKLRCAWAALGPDAQKLVRAHLRSPMANVLWDATEIVPSNYDVENRAPFNRAINVYGSGVPPR